MSVAPPVSDEAGYCRRVRIIRWTMFIGLMTYFFAMFVLLVLKCLHYEDPSRTMKLLFGLLAFLGAFAAAIGVFALGLNALYSKRRSVITLFFGTLAMFPVAILFLWFEGALAIGLSHLFDVATGRADLLSLWR